jgi:hypothetical protein
MPLVERARLFYAMTGAEPSSFIFRKNAEPPAFLIYTRRGLVRRDTPGPAAP